LPRFFLLKTSFLSFAGSSGSKRFIPFFESFEKCHFEERERREI